MFGSLTLEISASDPQDWNVMTLCPQQESGSKRVQPDRVSCVQRDQAEHAVSVWVGERLLTACFFEQSGSSFSPNH